MGYTLSGCTVFFALAVLVSAQSPRVVISGDRSAVKVENRSPVAINALDFNYMVDGKVVYHQVCINFDGIEPYVAAGASISFAGTIPAKYPPGTLFTFQVNGVLFLNGTILGHNTWQVERFAHMRDQMYSGQEVVIGPEPNRGDSLIAFYFLQQQFLLRHPNATIRTPQ